MSSVTDEQKNDMVKQLMSKYDKDGNGQLDKSEFFQMVRTVNGILAQFGAEQIAEEKFEEIFANLDVNQDSKIDLSELVEWLKVFL